MLIVGEKINTSLKGIEEAVANKDAKFIQELAKKQAEHNADIIDVNVGTRIHTEIEDMRWMVKVVQEVVDAPLSIDSPNFKAIEAGLEEHKGKAMVNSITAEKERMEQVLPLVQKFHSKIVALAMDDDGIPEDVEKRYSIAQHLIEVLTSAGIPSEDIYIDPMIRPVSTDSKCGKVVLEAIRKIKNSFKEVHIICGLSNISFGLPERGLLNRTFLLMAIAVGLDSAILDPLDKRTMAALRAGEAILGKDDYCARYLASFRKGEL
ncbi:MAG: methyltetrahydrofolate cobalamin methyltransferase [Candidatus Aerophobetes bacterium]|nr:methyltetrahydrofolate cobalamin methyltransferase [Candidatus Aerophobetes bacterium]